MKQICLSVAFLTTFFLLSCNNSTPLNEFELLTKENLNRSVEGYFQNAEKAEIYNLQTMFSNDSLCILHFDIRNKENNDDYPKGNFEYVFLSQNGKLYYSINNARDKEFVYFAKEKLDSIQKNRRFANLDYSNSLLQQSVENIIFRGNVVNEKEVSFSLKAPSEYGIWNFIKDRDEFGEEKSSESLIYMGHGDYYNNNYSSQGDFLFTLVISPGNSNILFRLYEDGASLVDFSGDYELKIKDCDGETHSFTLESYKGSIATWEKKDISDSLYFLFSKEKEMSLILRAKEGLQNSYKFKMNSYGFNKALNSNK